MKSYDLADLGLLSLGILSKDLSVFVIEFLIEWLR